MSTLKDLQLSSSPLRRLPDFVQLTRLNRPIGIYLLMWPTLWALWIATNGNPSFKLIFIFIAGVILTRTGGCIVNDFADRKFDGDVKRTANRPLATGRVSSKEALALAIVIMAAAFSLAPHSSLFFIIIHPLRLYFPSFSASFPLLLVSFPCCSFFFLMAKWK